METSRISRQTARIVDAWSPSKLRSGARAALNGFGHQETDREVKAERCEDESDLSTPP